MEIILLAASYLQIAAPYLQITADSSTTLLFLIEVARWLRRWQQRQNDRE